MDWEREETPKKGRFSRRERNPWGMSPWRLKMAPLIAVFCIAVMVLVGGFIGERANRAAKAAEEAKAIAAEVKSAPIPTGFAAMCVDLWMTAGGDEGASQRFLTNCNPGVDSSDLADQTPEAIQPQSTYAIGAPLSYTDENDPNLASVLVATRLREWEQVEDEGDFADRGIAYFRVAVYTNPQNGRQSLRGLPQQKAAPVDKEPMPLKDKLQFADQKDARVAAIQTFLTKLLVRPPAKNPREGDVTNYLWPDTDIVPVHSSKIDDVEVQQVAFTPDVESAKEVRVLVQVKVTYRGDNALIQQYPLILGRQGRNQWLVKNMPGAPALGEPTSEDTP
jgi:hypothetical protein